MEDATVGMQLVSSNLREALGLAAIFAVIKLLVQFGLTMWSSHLGYGYFRDEFYYLACGRHLAWGFVDHGPIVALQARLGEALFGTSVFAIRIFSALAGAIAVLLTGVLAWSLGGRRPSQGLAMLGVILCPQYIASHGYLSMNSFEPMFWGVCVLALILIERGGSQRLWWIVFGVAAGVGLLNKPSMTFFLVALGIGLLCTPQRRMLVTRWAAIGSTLSIAIAAPNVLWQMHHQWPTLEFLHNGTVEHKNLIVGPVQFLIAQVMTMQPVNILLWMTGIVALLRGRSIREMRWLGLVYPIFFTIMLALHAKDYYLAGVYPVFFAAGAIAWEHRFAGHRVVRENRVFAFRAFEAVLLVTTVAILPMASPVLQPGPWVRYTKALHLHGDATENAASGPLPQFYADRFGWKEQVDAVVGAYRALTPAERQTVCIYADNYGEAGALDLLGKQEEPSLPPAISGHNSYWMWGSHGCTGELLIAVSGSTPETLAKRYASVTVLAHMSNSDAMPFEHKNIYLLRHSLTPFDWKTKKFYI